jgi:hypothetical protein
MCDEVDELEDMQVDGVSAREDVSALSPRDLSKQGDAWFEYHAVSTTVVEPRLPHLVHSMIPLA